MARRRHTPEQVVNLLRQVEVSVANGKTTAQAEGSGDYGADALPLTQAIVALADQYGRYGYRRITALLQRDGWQVGKDRGRGSGVARG